MKDIMRMIAYILPVIIVAAVITAALSGYQMPSFEVEAVTEKGKKEKETENKKLVQKEKEAEEKEEKKKNKGEFQLDDGFYMGIGTGYGGPVSVVVEIKEQSISNIGVLSAEEEDKQFLTRAEEVIDRMIKEQSLEVDVVSGATYSSRGIIDGVKNALYGKVSNSSTKEKVSKTPAPLKKVKEAAAYKDGVYTGNGTGFGGDIKVQVKIKEGKIKTVKILEAAKEDSSYLKKAKDVLKKIIAKQSTNVDTVSGATYSSIGLIEAVRNALSKAENSNIKKADSKKEDDPKEKTVKKQQNQVAEQGKLPYKDGIYYGTGEGFAGDITVAIVIQDKTLKAALITATEDDDAFIEKAKQILYDVVRIQGVKVDVVSGATYSSKGIIEAVKNALRTAKDTAKGKTAATQKPEDTFNKDDNQGDNTSDSNSNTEDDTKDTSVVYQNGTYTMTAICYPDQDEEFYEYTISAKVTIQNDKIVDIKGVAGVGSDYDKSNDYFINRAVNGTSKIAGIIKQIINSQDLEKIDTVSGATCSSNALLEICKKAFEAAKK